MLNDAKRILADLIAFPTVSVDSNLEMIEYIAAHLRSCGAEVNIWPDPTGRKANLFATLGPHVDGGLVFSGHCDVVPVADQAWSTDPFELVERDGRLYGRGTCDMKGFIAATLALAPEFATTACSRPIHFAFTYDEETGCVGAGHLVQALAKFDIRPALALVGEPTMMRIVEGHKGCCEYTVRFQGLEGHGSAPDLGVNAVEYAVRYSAKLLELRDALKARAPKDCPFDPPWTTLNIGALNGGVVHNVIPSKAQLDWEMRPVQVSDMEFVKEHMSAFCHEELLPEMRVGSAEAAIHTEVVGEVAGLSPRQHNELRDMVVRLTGVNSTELAAFGTEAGIFQDVGMDVVICGPGNIEQAHKADEYLEIAQLSLCLDLLQQLAATSEILR